MSIGLAEVEIFLLLLDRLTAFADKVRTARAEGRTLTQEELDSFYQSYLLSENRLREAIERRQQ